MDHVVQALVENVEQTTALYEQVLDTERTKQRAIVASDMDALAEVVALEEQLMGHAADLENGRTGLRRQLAQEEPELGSHARLEDIIAWLGGPTGDLLARRRERLHALGAEIRQVNRSNFQLLRSSLDFLRDVIHSVFGSPPAPDVYDPTGQVLAASHDATRVDQML